MPIRIRTIQTRLADHPGLDALASLNFRVERDLMIELGKGRRFTGDLARTFYQRYGILAKNLDHIHNALKGRLDSVCECAKLNMVQLGEKIAAKSKDIARREKQIVNAQRVITREQGKKTPDDGIIARQHGIVSNARFALHQHKRRLDILEIRLVHAEASASDPKLCFGSRGLLRERNRIDPQDKGAIADWRDRWNLARSGEIFVPGDASAPDGNIFVRVQDHPDGGLRLLLRLPVALKHLADRTFMAGGVEVYEIDVGRIRFPHGGDVLAAMFAARERGEKHPVTWRIQRHDRGGWEVSCMFQEALPEVTVRDFSTGAVGVDFNAGFLTLAHVDGDGNPVATWNIPLVTHSRSSEQNLDTCRKAVSEIAGIAEMLGVPIVAEHLDFARKKAAVTSEQGARYARMLNGLAYATFAGALDSAAARHGILLKRVNPAFTSVAGHAKFSRRLGISTHAGAAICIARRAMRFSERVPALVEASLGRDVHVTLPRPEVSHEAGIVNDAKAKALSSRRHVWASWRRICVQRKAALTAHLRSVRKDRSTTSSRKASGLPAGPAGSYRRSDRDSGRGHRSQGCGPGRQPFRMTLMDFAEVRQTTLQHVNPNSPIM